MRRAAAGLPMGAIDRWSPFGAPRAAVRTPLLDALIASSAGP